MSSVAVDAITAPLSWECVIPNSDIKPVFSGVDTTLFPDRIVIAFNFVLADAGIAAAGHLKAKREASTCGHAVLSAVVTVTVLKARNGQVVADICCDFLATDLSPDRVVSRPLVGRHFYPSSVVSVRSCIAFLPCPLNH